jgi:hypothetical protein
MNTARINRADGYISHLATVVVALTIMLALTAVVTQSAQSQTYTVIHNFTGRQDGAHPYAGLTIDKGETCTELRRMAAEAMARSLG